MPLFCLQLFEQGLNNGSGDTTRSYRIIPPDPLRSLSFEPKYSTFNTGDGYCARTELTGCVSTSLEGELVTEGQYKNGLKYVKKYGNKSEVELLLFSIHLFKYIILYV